MRFLPGDELAHVPSSDDPTWSEAWFFDFAVEGELACVVQFTTWPAGGLCRYRACAVGAEGPTDLVAVVDDDVPLPTGRSLELRTHGLWADHIVETAFDHVSVGCEAFALRVDPPLDLAVELVGERVPFGLDLGWETEGEVVARTDGSDGAVQGYDMACVVYGEVLLGDGRILVDRAPGHRGHLWGRAPLGPVWLTTSTLPEALLTPGD